jgi:anaerobic magnesium-protoporphyrin IX monomethyl ester cyclase
MRLAFVHCPFSHKKFAENLKTVDEEFCVAPPIVLAYVAAIAEKAGHKVTLLDCRVFRLTKAQAAERLKKFKPDLLAFRFDTYNFHQTLSWAKYLKKRLKVPVLAGGINFSLYPKEAMTHETIDYALRGEVLYSLPKLLEVLEGSGDQGNRRSGNQNPVPQYPDTLMPIQLKSLPGLMYRNKGKFKINPLSKKLASFDDYPFPARHLLPNHLYSSYLTQRRPYTIMLTVTGCPYDCTFCAIAPLPYRVRSAESVLAEIKECVEKYGIKEIDFFDATFFLPRKRALKIFKGIQKAGWEIEWACRSRVDVVDDEVLREAAKAGCKRIYFGIESSHPDVLKAINKQIDIPQVKKTIDLSHKHDIKAMGFFMVGNPGETKESIWDSVRFAKSLGLDFVQFSRTIAKPGSQLAKNLAQQTGKDYWRDFILGKMREKRLPTPWTKLKQKEIERYTKLAYYRFYFRPGFVIKTVLRSRSLGEVFRYIRVGFKMLFYYFKFD